MIANHAIWTGCIGSSHVACTVSSSKMKGTQRGWHFLGKGAHMLKTILNAYLQTDQAVAAEHSQNRCQHSATGVAPARKKNTKQQGTLQPIGAVVLIRDQCRCWDRLAPLIQLRPLRIDHRGPVPSHRPMRGMYSEVGPIRQLL